jgi:hypothetical protein
MAPERREAHKVFKRGYNLKHGGDEDLTIDAQKANAGDATEGMDWKTNR